MGLKTKTILQISPRFERVQLQTQTRAASLHYSSTTHRTKISTHLWSGCDISHLGTAQGKECLQWQTAQTNDIHSIPVNSNDFGEGVKEAAALCNLGEVKEPTKQHFQ